MTSRRFSTTPRLPSTIDEPPFFDDAPPPFDDAPPPFDGDPPFDADPPASPSAPARPAAPRQTAAFSGFANDAAGGFRASAAPVEENDDEQFDYEAFMREHEGRKKAAAQPEAAPPAPVSVPAAAPAAAAADGRIDGKTWENITFEAERSNRTMIGLLEQITAEIRGDVVLLFPKNPNVRFMLGGGRLEKFVAPAVERVLHKHYQVRFGETQ